MDGTSPQPKRRGRPPAPPEARRRHNLTFRIRSDLRDKLEGLAAHNGRSISEEIELLIELSLGVGQNNISSQEALAFTSIEMTDDVQSTIEKFRENTVCMQVAQRAMLIASYAQLGCNNEEVKIALNEIAESMKLQVLASAGRMMDAHQAIDNKLKCASKIDKFHRCKD